MVVPGQLPPAAGTTGWLFHIDVPHVSATHWSPLVESGSLVGFRVRLLEMEGRKNQLKLRSCRLPQQARQTTFEGQAIATLATQSDAVIVDIKPYEWLQLAVHW
jgi:predicted thioesterase